MFCVLFMSNIVEFCVLYLGVCMKMEDKVFFYLNEMLVLGNWLFCVWVGLWSNVNNWLIFSMCVFCMYCCRVLVFFSVFG